MRANRARGGLVVLWIATMLAGCAKATRLTPSEYSDPGFAHLFIVRTVDGEKYRVSRYEYSDSTIVISELRQATSETSSTTRQTPFAIPLDQIESIEKVTPHEGRVFTTAVVLTALFVVLGGIAAANGFPGSD